MQNVILVIHILACVALTAVVLLQRSEGGALGIGGGGGGGGGGLMSGRGAAGALVRTTMIFAGVFFVTSLFLTTLANRNQDDRTQVERALEGEGAGAMQDALDADTPLLLDPLGEGDDTGPPAGEAGEAPAGEAPPVSGDPLAEAPAETPAGNGDGAAPEDAPN